MLIIDVNLDVAVLDERESWSSGGWRSRRPVDATTTANSTTLEEGTFSTPWAGNTLAVEALLGGKIDTVEVTASHTIRPLLQLTNTGPGGPADLAFTLDADADGTHLLWVDNNHDLWTWASGEPTRLATGYANAEW